MVTICTRKVWEAFVYDPVNAAMPRYSVGLFEGEPDAIQTWVAEASDITPRPRVNVYEREVRLVTAKDFDDLVLAKAKARDSQQLVEQLTKGVCLHNDLLRRST